MRPELPIDGSSFELQIPVIGYSAMVRQGVGLSVLAHSPGHYPTTPWPGQPGNVGVAAHNVYWLSFNRLKVGDRVEIGTQHGMYLYAITGWRVTSPGDRTVLAPTSDDRLTLTTCYPLWAGAFATQRLIYTAQALGGVA
jgi:sortase A